MKILITGISGFIGFHLANYLIKRGKDIEVIGIDNLNNYYDINLKLARLEILKKNKIKIHKVDIKNFKKIEKIFVNNKFDKIVHLAAQAGVRLSFTDPQNYFDNNILGFFNILELSKKYNIKNLIYSSSSSVYGDQKKFPLTEEIKDLNTVSFYGFTKKNNEDLAEFYSRNHKLSIIGLRFFTVYGSFGRPDMSPFIFTKNILEGKPITLNNNGKHMRDFTYIDDVVNIIYSLLKKDIRTKHSIYNVCSSNPIKITESLNIIEDCLGKKAKIKLREKQKGDVIKTYGSNLKINKFINKDNYVDIKTGMRVFTDWFKNNYY